MNEGSKSTIKNSKFLTLLIFITILVLVIPVGSYLLYGFYTKYKYPYQETNQSINVKDPPDQDHLPYKMDPIIIQKSDSNYWIIPKYKYDISGEILISDSYWTGGPMIPISPLDLSIAWGYITHPKIQQYLEYDHGHRFYTWRFANNTPAKIKKAREFIITHSSNNHIIAANERIEFGLLNAGDGDEVRLKGFLVDVHKFNKEGNLIAEPWTTSEHRYDHGKTGCEIIYVYEAQINNRLYTSDFNPLNYEKS